MGIWKESIASRQTSAPAPVAMEPTGLVAPPKPEPVRSAVPRAAPVENVRSRAQSLIAADLTIEGRIEGGGSISIAGNFKGAVNIQGDLTIETGAKLIGDVRANKVTIAGELEGNVEEASRVDLLETGAVTGDMKVGSLTVAAGARMRGHNEVGWKDAVGVKAVKHVDGNGGDTGAGT